MPNTDGFNDIINLILVIKVKIPAQRKIDAVQKILNGRLAILPSSGYKTFLVLYPEEGSIAETLVKAFEQLRFFNSKINLILVSCSTD